MSRRRVRVSESFFEQLDELFGPDRGENGEPSRLDFTLFELPDVMERFAVDWDRLPGSMSASEAVVYCSRQGCSCTRTPCTGS